MNQLKGTMNRLASLILVAALVFSMLPVQNVRAEEVISGIEEETVPEEVAGVGEETIPEDLTGGEEETIPEDLTGAGEETIPEDPTGAGEAADLENAAEGEAVPPELQYVYVENSYIDLGNNQEILISFAENSSPAGASLIYEREDTGEQFEVQAAEVQGAAVLFRIGFTDAGQTGFYRLAAVRIYDGIQEYRYDFSELGMECQFGVNQECETNPDAVVEESDEAAAFRETADAEVVFLTLDDNEELVESTSAEEVLEEAADSDLRYLAGNTGKSTGTGSGSDVIVVLDPGHGGSDGGAVANDANEKDLTLKIAKYCKAELQQYSGVTVYMTRESDVYVGLTERVDFAKEKGADIFVSIHLNSTGTGKAKGAEVYYPNSNYNASLGQQGKELAQKIQNELTALGLADRGIKIRDSDDGDKYPDDSTTDYYSVIRNSKKAGIPGIIVEHAFLDNSEDYKDYLNSDAKLKKLGQADASGIASYFGLTKSGGTNNGGGNNNSGGNNSGGTNNNGGTGGSGTKGTWVKDGADWYYYDASGAMVTGWALVNGTWYYLNADGKMATGWLLRGNTWYYLNASGAMCTGWVFVKGFWYYLSGSGAMVTGWLNLNGTWYYLSGSGAMVTGWLNLNGTWYYLSGSGAMCTGWVFVNGFWYYLSGSGAMVTGWLNLNGTWYYLSGSGAMVTGWLNLNGTWYYLSGSGAMVTGWLNLNGTWYYLSESGAMVTGWKTIHKRKYYFNTSGAMVTGNQVIDGVSYYFGEYGIEPDEEPEPEQQADGWSKQNGTWYYYSNGEKVTGWRKIGAYWYYMNLSGAMQTGWLSEDGNKYYLNPAASTYGPEGAMTKGYREISGTWYFFNNSTSPLGALTYTGVTPIMGTSELGSNKTTVVNKLVKMYNKQGKTYPAETLKKGGAATIKAFCQLLYDEAVQEGVKPEVVFGQAMKETGYLQFGGDVKAEQFNFCGLGATGNGAAGNSFDDVKTGLRAQVQHLKAYASDEALNAKCVDPRFQYVTRNIAPYVEWLGIQENPENKGWAASVGYGMSLMKDYINPISAL